MLCHFSLIFFVSLVLRCFLFGNHYAQVIAACPFPFSIWFFVDVCLCLDSRLRWNMFSLFVINSSSSSWRWCCDIHTAFLQVLCTINEVAKSCAENINEPIFSVRTKIYFDENLRVEHKEGNFAQYQISSENMFNGRSNTRSSVLCRSAPEKMLTGNAVRNTWNVIWKAPLTHQYKRTLIPSNRPPLAR